MGDFLHTMKRLRTCGIHIQSRNVTVHADLVAVMCDTPAAAALGGFKESSSFAEHFCRNCMASNKTYKKFRYEEDFELRHMDNYRLQCGMLENANLKGRRDFWSKTYGLNQRSCLCAIPDFDVTQCLLQDPMHILLEGSVPYLLALFLNDTIYRRRLFTLQTLNKFLIEPTTFLQERRDIVLPIEQKQIRKAEHVKQKASTMLAMTYRLPLFFGQYLDENDAAYRNLLCLIRITCICFKPVTDVTLAGVLSQEICDFLTSFCEIYGEEKVKPKMHFMIHFPRQMLQFGPLRHHSTMRAEAKHQSFKDHRWMNFTNLSWSLLKRHQLCFANVFSDNQGNICTKFLQEGAASCSKYVKQEVLVKDLEEEKRSPLLKHFNLHILSL